MFAAMRWLLIPALLAGWLLPAGAVRASRAAAPSPAGVRDEAGMFPEEAKKKADQKIQQIKENYGAGLLIETVPGIPEADRAKFEELGKAEKAKFFLRWAEARAQKSGVRGVYVLVCKKPGHVQVVANETLREKGFTTSVREEMAQKLAAGFRAGGKPGDGLLAAVDYADAKLKTIVGKRSAAGASATAGAGGRQSAPPEEKRGFFSGLWGWICIGLVVVMGLWLVFGLIRALTGAGRPAGYGGAPGGPGGGYGGGGYGGGGGGGGGGFLTSLMGGMFGAAAGSWIYDSFFRGSHGGGGGGWSQAQAGAPPTAAPTPGGGDADYGGNTGGGADFGDNDGGGGGGASFGDNDDGGGGADFGDNDGGGGADFGDDGGGGADFGGGGDDGGGADF